MRGSGPKERALEIYLREIESFPAIGPKEERELLIKAKKGDREAIAKLVYAHLKFVVRIAMKYQNYGVPLADLINEGNLGLLKAIDHFDLKRNVRFLSYAVWWVRQAIFKALDNMSSTVRITPEKRAMLKKMKEAEQKLIQETGITPNIYEIAEEMGVEPEDVSEAKRIAQRDVSLDMPINPDSKEGTLSDMIEQTALPSPAESYEAEEMGQILLKMLHKLGRKERNILVNYYGLEGQEPKTLEEIGKMFNISRERVRQIRDRALEKLRRWHEKELHEFIKDQ